MAHLAAAEQDILAQTENLAAGYPERAGRLVPGLHDFHLMVGLLLAERVPTDGRILVLGAGGGMELKSLARTGPGWRFDGVDPSEEMLEQARRTLGDLAGRVDFCKGYIDDAPEGPFDGATCLLTLHFLPKDERRKTLDAIHRRLRPGAPFVAMHHSFPNTGPDADRWLARNAAFAALGAPATDVAATITAMKARLPSLSPDEDVALMQEAGFTGVELFYAAFTFKGWVGYRA